MKHTTFCLSLLVSLPLWGMKAPVSSNPVANKAPFQTSYHPTQPYEPFRVQDGVAFSFDIAASYFDAKARLTAAKDYKHPDINRYDNWKKYCEDSAQDWSAKQSYNPVYNADLKNPKHVAGLGLSAAVTTLVALKVLNWAIDYTWAMLSQQAQK